MLYQTWYAMGKQLNVNMVLNITTASVKKWLVNNINYPLCVNATSWKIIVKVNNAIRAEC